MGRVINIENPTKVRNRNRRTIAELLRRLSEKPTFDEEAQDMAAAITLALWEIADGVEQTVRAWEKRDYWMKAERFLRDWQWVPEAASNLDDVIRNDAWDLLPELLAELFPRFADVQLKSMTRKPSEWRGKYAELVAQEPRPLPY